MEPLLEALRAKQRGFLMEISYARAAVKVINGMDRPTKQRIKAALEKLPEGDVKPLKGSTGTYRLRVGDWAFPYLKIRKQGQSPHGTF